MYVGVCPYPYIYIYVICVLYVYIYIHIYIYVYVYTYAPTYGTPHVSTFLFRVHTSVSNRMSKAVFPRK